MAGASGAEGRRNAISAWACALAAACALLPGAASAALIQATTLEAGDWLDPALWIFDVPPAAATYPDDDGVDAFDVRIGELGDTADVSLSADVSVAALGIVDGSALRIDSAGVLSLAPPVVLEGFGVLRNEGQLTLAGSLFMPTGFTLEGHGVLHLVGGVLGSADGSATRIVNGDGHRIRGSGTIDVGGDRLVSAGVVEADAEDALAILGDLYNLGAMRVSGTGGLSVSEELRNLGAIEVSAGSALEVGRPYRSFAGSSLLFDGAGATGSFRDMTNDGHFEVRNGAVVSATSLDQNISEALLRIGADSRLEVLRGVTSASRILLEGGQIAAGDAIVIERDRFAFGSLEGSGTIVLTSPDPSDRRLVILSGDLAPGLDGSAGLLDVTGDLVLGSTGNLEVDLFGPGAYDRVTASGTASFSERSRVVFHLGDEFVSRPGDRYEILRAAGIETSASTLGEIFEIPPLFDEDVFLVARLLDGSTSQSLEVAGVERIVATSAGGAYGDPGTWSFDRPTDATIPNHGPELEVFEVRVSGGPERARVELDTDVIVAKLRIDRGDTFSIAPGASLGFEPLLGHPQDEVVINDGTLRVEGRIVATRDLSFNGTGTLVLADGSIEPSAGALEFANSPGHTLLASGSVSITDALFVNRGTLRVDRDSLLEISSAAVGGPFSNEGTLDLAAGSRLGLAFRPGASQYFTQQDALARTIVRAGAELDSDITVYGGSVELDGGTILGSVDLTRLGATRLSGSGTVAGSVTVSETSTVAPGFGWGGLLEIQGNLGSTGGTIRFTLAGNDPSRYDRLHVRGTTPLVDTRIEVDVAEGFSPRVGDRFEIFTTETGNFLFQPFSRWIDAPALDGSLYFDANASLGATRTLALSVVQLSQARWNGGAGSWASGGWSYDLPPLSAAFPNRDADDFFDAIIESGDVSLARAVGIDSLVIGSGAALTLLEGGRLTLADTIGRAETGRIENDGVIRFEQTDTGGTLVGSGTLEIAGSGVIELGDTAANRFSSTFNTPFTIENGEAQTIRGSGGIGIGPSDRFDFVNRGTLEATGVHGIHLGQTLTNLGLLEIAPDTRVVVDRDFRQEAGRTRIGAGAKLQLGAGFEITHSSVELDGGAIEVLGRKLAIGEGGRVSGNGRISLLSTISSSDGLDLLHGGILDPGSNGVGVLEIDGTLHFFGGTIALDLGGAGGSASDFMDIRNVRFVRGGTIALSALDDLTLAPGDTVPLLRSDSSLSVGFRNSLSALFEGPALDSGYHLVPHVVSDATGNTLSLSLGRLHSATWQGGVGSWTETPAWDLGGGTPAAFYPDNTLDALFDATIDSGTGSAAVTLNADVAIDSLFVGAGDSLLVEGGRLTLAATIGREQTGRIVNDGTITLGPASSSARPLVGTRTLEIDGSGEIVLGAGVFTFAISGGDFGLDFIQRAGHTIRGSGGILLNGGTLTNEGTIEGDNLDVLFSPVKNRGLLRITGQDSIITTLENSGLLEVVSKGGLETTSTTNSGNVLVSGAGNGMIVHDELVNTGRIEVRDGATLHADVLRQSGPDAVFLVSGSTVGIGENTEEGVEISGGALVLDDGRVEGANFFDVRGEGRIEGVGAVAVSGFFRGPLRIFDGGTLAPGLDGAGELVVDRMLELDGGRLELEIGAPGEEHDVLTILGTAFLDGEIEVSVLRDVKGLELGYGDVFDLVLATERILLGHLGLSLPELDKGLFWSTEVVEAGFNQALRFRVVPEPGTGSLLLLGLLALAARRRAT